MAEWQNRIVRYDVKPASSFLANESNWRIHPRQQQDVLLGSLTDVGWATDVIVNLRSDPSWGADRGVETLIDGHLRVSLALREGDETPVPVKFIDVTRDEENILLASLDPIAALAIADKEKLDALLRDTKPQDAALQQFLSELAAKEGLYPTGGGALEDVPEPKVDRADELQEKWGTQLGQLWEIGRHRLLCGDCTSAESVRRLTHGQLASLVITDPPYGVSYADKNIFLNTIGPANRIETPIVNDHASKADTQAMWKAAFTHMAEVMAPGAVVYCFMPQGGDQMMMMMMMMMEGAGIEPRHELIWLKNNHVLGRADYAYKHEPILYAWKEGGHHFYGDFQTSILEFRKPQKSDVHPTTKPVELIAQLMENSSLVGEVVYDGFLGSGTTMVVAEQLGRLCYGCDIEPKYIAVTLERLSQMGLTPRLIAS